jgi:TfoX N-terminal domain
MPALGDAAFVRGRVAAKVVTIGRLAVMVRSHMACGLIGNDLMLRVGAAREADALAQPHARPMDFTHRPMTGMIYVAPAGVRTAAALRGWVDRSLAFVATLPVSVERREGATAPAISQRMCAGHDVGPRDIGPPVAVLATPFSVPRRRSDIRATRGALERRAHRQRPAWAAPTTSTRAEP